LLSMASEWAIQMAESAKRRMLELGKSPIVEIVEPLEIFERDSWSCQICHRPVNPKSIDPYDPQRVTLDHRMPIALGGAHSKSNLQTAHLSCNSRKGASPQAPS
jgi:5-methylcytosine-specific restriction endonuclease McrA